MPVSFNEVYLMNRKQIIKHAVLGAALLCAQSVLAASFKIDVDTSPLSGSNGFLDLQLNPSDGSAPRAIANVGSLLGSISLTGAPATTGDVIGALPGTVALANSAAFNDYFQPVQFGTSFSLLVDFADDFLTQPSFSSSVFALSLYDSTGASPLLTTDPTGSLALFQLDFDGITFQTFPVAPGAISAAQVSPTAVPLPATAWLFLLGLLPMFSLQRSRHR
jgi:hypothetical protein